MFASFVAPIRKVVHSLITAHTPSQLAAGFTLGMIIGFVPKSNLIALSLCVLLFSLRCNKGLALTAAIVFTCVSTWIDPFAHKLGLSLLGLPSMQAHYASALMLPVGPWVGFHNTVVTGSLAIGLYAAYPVYWVTKTLCALLQRGVTA